MFIRFVIGAPSAPIDTLSELITRIKAYSNEEIGINFLASETEFEWKVEGTESLSLKGESLSANGISHEAWQKLTYFFADNNFELAYFEPLTIAGLFAFKKGDLVCTVYDIVSQHVPSGFDVKIKCGVLDVEALSQFSKEKLIRIALAQKHDESVSHVKIHIDKETENHVRGNVTIFSADETSSSGYFLAAKVDGTWKIVIDGNGAIPCSLVRSYDFPENMIEDCWEG